MSAVINKRESTLLNKSLAKLIDPLNPPLGGGKIFTNTKNARYVIYTHARTRKKRNARTHANIFKKLNKAKLHFVAKGQKSGYNRLFANTLTNNY